MGNRRSSNQPEFIFSTGSLLEETIPRQSQIEAMAAELQASFEREETLQFDHDEQVRRNSMQSKEFEHRLLNGLQMISGLLISQSRIANSEASAQLAVAAGRIDAFGRVHRHLHLLDCQKQVEFNPYLQQLCDDLSGLLSQHRAGCRITVNCTNEEIPTAFAVPMSFIVNELVTNSAKYAEGDITVQFQASPSGKYSLSVSDEGPGLSAEFDPSNCKGLGMKIVLSLVKQIGGELHVMPKMKGRGARFTITFSVPVQASTTMDGPFLNADWALCVTRQPNRFPQSFATRPDGRQ